MQGCTSCAPSFQIPGKGEHSANMFQNSKYAATCPVADTQFYRISYTFTVATKVLSILQPTTWVMPEDGLFLEPSAAKKGRQPSKRGRAAPESLVKHQLDGFDSSTRDASFWVQKFKPTNKVSCDTVTKK